MGNTVAWVAIAISVVSAVVALASYWTAREKLRLDLYDRRFQIYRRAIELHKTVLFWSPTEREQGLGIVPSDVQQLLDGFAESALESNFLFGEPSGIPELLFTLGDDAFQIVNWKVGLGPQIARLDPPKFVELSKEHGARLERLRVSIGPLREKMAPFLNFHSYSALPRLFDEVADEWP